MVLFLGCSVFLCFVVVVILGGGGGGGVVPVYFVVAVSVSWFVCLFLSFYRLLTALRRA